jgi:peroxiredoxin
MTTVECQPTAQIILPASTSAPDFSLQAHDGQEITLEQLRGNPAILVFYPADFSPVCTDQLALYNEVLPVFEKYGAQLIGISVDSRWAHQAFVRDRNLHFPLLADFEPKGEVARKYGAYNYRKGRAARALFVLDTSGVITWSYLSPNGKNPGADGILHALEDLKASQPAPEGRHA